MILADPVLGAQRQQMRHTLTAKLYEADANGALRFDVDAAALAEFLFAMLSGLSARAREGATRQQLHAIAEVARQGWFAQFS